jgi:hypothetical protein
LLSTFGRNDLGYSPSMSDKSEPALIRSYRGTLEAFRGLLTIAERLASAHRPSQELSASELTHVEEKLLSGRTKIEKLDVFLALWPKPDDQVH